jgi:hypothetical protein
MLWVTACFLNEYVFIAKMRLFLNKGVPVVRGFAGGWRLSLLTLVAVLTLVATLPAHAAEPKAHPTKTNAVQTVQLSVDCRTVPDTLKHTSS